MLSFAKNRQWVKILQSAVNSLNNRSSPALDHLSPNQAFQAKNMARVQMFRLRRKAAYDASFKREKRLKVGQSVLIVKEDPFRQRGFKPRWSSEVYHITKVLTNQVPTGYRISTFGKRMFYRQELNPVANQETLASSMSARKILAIFSQKKFAVQWLRNGKPIKFQEKFLVKTNLNSENQYMTQEEILTFDNGLKQLTEYQNRNKK